MADEILKRDSNNQPVSGAITNDSNQFIKMARIDDTTKGLKVMVVGGAGTGTVTSVSVVSANGLAGTVATATTTPAITLSTTVTGILKGNGTAISGIAIPSDATKYLDGTGAFSVPVGSGGTVTAVSVATANGFSGSSTGGATPALTIVAGDIVPGTVVASNTTTPHIDITAGSTNTGYFLVNGKTSGSLKITTVDAAARAITLSLAAQTVGIATLTIPDMANTNKTIAWLESPVFTTPNIGAATATTINGNTFTTGTGVLTIAASKTLTISNTLTFAGTDGKGINVGAATTGKILIGDGTNMVLSANTFPNASATTRKIIVSDGTNWVASTETYAVPGSSGNILTSDGTNWTSAAPTAVAVNFQRFTATGANTWTKPAGVTTVKVICIGAGGGGGGGTAAASGNVRDGGSGGGGGAVSIAQFKAADLGATETATVGVGGTASAGGANGGNGGNSTFGTWLLAGGGGGAGKGDNSGNDTRGGAGGGTGGQASVLNYVTTPGVPLPIYDGVSFLPVAVGGAGAGGSTYAPYSSEFGGASGGGHIYASGAASQPGGSSIFGGPAGGGGGSISAANATTAPGAGGNNQSYANGGGGAAGTSGGTGTGGTAGTSRNLPYCGQGGGGGGSSTTNNTNGGTGGAGGAPGGGGGGGGAPTGTGTSTGGVGGRGEIWVISW